MTALTLVTARELEPVSDLSSYVVTYSKTAAGDTIDCKYSDGIVTTTNGPFLPIKTIRFVDAVTNTSGVADPATYATTVVTLTTGTGAGHLLLIGNC